MKFYRSIFLIILLLVVVIICVSCSRNKDNDNSGGINIFRPKTNKIDQYSRNIRGTTRPEVGRMGKSLRNVQYENDNETLFGYLAAVIGFIALIVLALLLERYFVYRMKTVADSPAALFVELCAAHQLTRMERNLLERVAESADMNDPLPVFMEPKYLQEAIDNRKFKDLQQMIEYLLTKLFENKSDSSILKRSSILIQSELNSGSNIGNKSENNLNNADSTITYETTQIKN
ncbi:MAG: hypothetical protein LBT09_10435 [Planctomycetaceae bacterium]|jgi:hypothetical protein|nr:hypothetical protein [Planctomycetaceae bacterium]